MKIQEKDMVNFGTIDRYLLFGGGELLINFGLLLQRKKEKVFVITSPRHAIEIVKNNEDNKSDSLENTLKKFGFHYVITQDLNIPDIQKLITKNTLGISLGAAWIFDEMFIDQFGGRLLNLHGARLPQDRGGGGFSWRILRRDRLGYCLIHLLEPGIDKGHIIKNKEYLFPDSCRIPSEYQNYSNSQYLLLLDEFTNEVAYGKNFGYQAQLEFLSSYWPRIKSDIHGYINWDWCLWDIEPFICAFDDPYPGARTYIGDKEIRLKKCASYLSDGSFHPFQTGIIYRKSENMIFVACHEGTLIIREAFDTDNNNVMNELVVGQRFYTPFALLEKAKKTRVIYTTSGNKEK